MSMRCVARPARMPERLPEVFSYDLITDGIRAIVAQGHIHLVETLAERIAASVLAHPQIRSVTVRVEKLEVGPGSVGVEITRAKELAPIIVRRILARLGKLRHQRMPRREMAHRIGRARIAGEREGLAAAAAEILLLPRA